MKSGEARLSHTESRELSDAATSRLSSPSPIPDRGRKTRYWMKRETEREKEEMNPFSGVGRRSKTLSSGETSLIISRFEE